LLVANGRNNAANGGILLENALLASGAFFLQHFYFILTGEMGPHRFLSTPFPQLWHLYNLREPRVGFIFLVDAFIFFLFAEDLAVV